MHCSRVTLPFLGWPGVKMAKDVPESLLKKRQRDEQWATQRAADRTEARKKAKENRKVIFKKAEAYVKEYRQQVRCLEYSKAAVQTLSPELSRREVLHILLCLVVLCKLILCAACVKDMLCARPSPSAMHVLLTSASWACAEQQNCAARHGLLCSNSDEQEMMHCTLRSQGHAVTRIQSCLNLSAGGRPSQTQARGQEGGRLLCGARVQACICHPHPRYQRHAPQDSHHHAAAAAAADQ